MTKEQIKRGLVLLGATTATARPVAEEIIAAIDAGEVLVPEFKKGDRFTYYCGGGGEVLGASEPGYMVRNQDGTTDWARESSMTPSPPASDSVPTMSPKVLKVLREVNALIAAAITELYR